MLCDASGSRRLEEDDDIAADGEVSGSWMTCHIYIHAANMDRSTDRTIALLL